MIFTEYWKVLVLNFSQIENTVFFPAKKLMEKWHLLNTEKFWTFVLNFSEMRYMVFFEPKSWWKDDIYWLLESSCFELFRDGKYGPFLSEKVDGKMIFTWSFWAFHDIPGLGKYGFACSGMFSSYMMYWLKHYYIHEIDILLLLVLLNWLSLLSFSNWLSLLSFSNWFSSKGISGITWSSTKLFEFDMDKASKSMIFLMDKASKSVVMLCNTLGKNEGIVSVPLDQCFEKWSKTFKDSLTWITTITLSVCY